SGAQIGTAFLNTPEAATNDLHRAALLAAEDGQTKVTKVISGRPARGLVNRYMAEMADREDDTLPFPLQYSVTRPLQAASREQGSDAFLSLWAGQAVALNRVLPAADLVELLVEETRAALANLGR
ncbi:MAG: nitronate monooxygenase, partial [Proteobacteria bacterium]|nr:nitronate monooxygenase [Pseudomonadota bacterium]